MDIIDTSRVRQAESGESEREIERERQRERESKKERRSVLRKLHYETRAATATHDVSFFCVVKRLA